MIMVLLLYLFAFYLQDFQIHQITKDAVWKVVDVVSCQIPNTHKQEFHEIQERTGQPNNTFIQFNSSHWLSPRMPYDASQKLTDESAKTIFDL